MPKLSLPYPIVKLLGDKLHLEARALSPMLDLTDIVDQFYNNMDPQLLSAMENDLIAHQYLIHKGKKYLVSNEMTTLITLLYQPPYNYKMEAKTEKELTRIYYLPVGDSFIRVQPESGLFHISWPVTKEVVSLEIRMQLGICSNIEDSLICVSLNRPDYILSSCISIESNQFVLIGSRIHNEKEEILSGQIPRCEENLPNIIRIIFGEEKYPSEYEYKPVPKFKEPKEKIKFGLVARGVLITLGVNACVSIFTFILKLILVQGR